MRYVQTEHVASGMKLARPLYGDNGQMLVRGGCTISDTILKHINNMGLQGVYIDEPGFEDVVVNDVVPMELKQEAYRALQDGNYDKCVIIAKTMVKEMLSVKSIDMDLLDIKSDKDYEYRHCISVALISITMGINMGLNAEQLDNLAVAGLLHDIGKFDVAKRLLTTSKVYKDKQMDEMKKHPMYSYEALKDNPNITSVARNAILFHHENLDGTGYYNITADKLGTIPRILRIADTYDALTATRKHRAAFTPEHAITELVEGAGKIYDRSIVRTFIDTFPVFPKAFTVKLQNGETGVVVDNSNDNYRPRIRTFEGKNIDLFTDPEYKNINIEEIL